MVQTLENLDKSLHHFSTGTGDYSEHIQVPWREMKPKKVTKGDKFREGVLAMKTCYTKIYNSIGGAQEEVQEGHDDMRKSTLELMKISQKKS